MLKNGKVIAKLSFRDTHLDRWTDARTKGDTKVHIFSTIQTKGPLTLLFLASALVTCRHIHNAVSVDVKHDLDLRHSTGHGRDARLEHAQVPVYLLNKLLLPFLMSNLLGSYFCIEEFNNTDNWKLNIFLTC